MTTPHTTESPDRLLREDDAAEHLGVAPRTLADWRLTGRGPRFIRMSRKVVRYRVSELNQWLEERTFRSTSEVPA